MKLRSRSEEHTSELQSQSNLVCRLLLDPAAPDISTLSLHDALPICLRMQRRRLVLVDAHTGREQRVVARVRGEARDGNVGQGTAHEHANVDTAPSCAGKKLDEAAIEIGRAHV